MAYRYRTSSVSAVHTFALLILAHSALALPVDVHAVTPSGDSLKDVALRAKAISESISQKLSAMQQSRHLSSESTREDKVAVLHNSLQNSQKRMLLGQLPMENDASSLMQQSLEGVSHQDSSAKESTAELEHDLEGMQAKLVAANDRKNTLQSENSKLKQELAGWLQAGKQVAQREGKVVDLLENAHASQQGSQSQWSWRWIHVVIILGLAVFAIVANLAAKPCIQTSKPLLMASPRSSWNLLPFQKARAFFWKPCVLEVSEIRAALPGLVLCGDFAVHLQVGPHRTYGTRAVEVFDSDSQTTMKFSDLLAFKLSPSDAVVTFSIVDKDFAGEKLASVEVATKELMALASRKHGEYVRFNLTCPALKSKRIGKWPRQKIDESYFGDESEPFVAMRLRDISKTTRGKAELAKSSPRDQVMV